MKKYLFSTLLIFGLSNIAFAEDTVDLQWSVCDSSPEAVLHKINQGADKSAALKSDSAKQITYYDSGSGQYILDGVSFRTKAASAQLESSVKIRFTKAKSVSGANCEWDRYGSESRYTCEIVNSVQGNGSTWSSDQMDFLENYYQSVGLDSLTAYGPYKNLKWKFDHGNEKVAFDTVDTDSGLHLMEFSIKVALSEGDGVYSEFSNWLAQKNVVLCDRQESKTMRLFRALGILNP